MLLNQHCRLRKGAETIFFIATYEHKHTYTCLIIFLFFVVVNHKVLFAACFDQCGIKFIIIFFGEIQSQDS